MWVRVRTFDGKRLEIIDGLSKLTLVGELKKKISKTFSINVSQQRLFFRGKQLENGHTLYDYSVGLNEIIQLLIKQDEAYNHTPLTEEIPDEYIYMPVIPGLYKLGDIVDVRDDETGAWFEAIITNYGFKMKINDIMTSKFKNISDWSKLLLYQVQYLGYEKVLDIQESFLIPRVDKLLNAESLKEGQNILANYNIDDPIDRGYWYICKINTILQKRKPLIVVDINLGDDNEVLEGCKLKFLDEFYEIPHTSMQNSIHYDLSNISKQIEDYLLNNTNLHEIPVIDTSIKPLRKLRYTCDVCKDNVDKKCRKCHCQLCGGKDDLEKQLMCDECDRAWHAYCLDPPIEEFPSSDEDWYCHECKLDQDEIVKAGEPLKKRKITFKSSYSTGKSPKSDDFIIDKTFEDGSSDSEDSTKSHARSTKTKFHDWGKGMACVGRTKVCTIVPSNHFGPIPGVEVGTLWKFRLQVSEAGVHRPPVGGIHGREDEGAYSIILSGGYEDDEDFGDEFYYTGSGGRDLSGNKRTAAQSCDQTLTKYNKSLAKNCACALDAIKGGEAKNWESGLPIRVVRNYKGAKVSKYAPEEGNRYDGIYKVVKYWPDVGKSGFKVWRYFLRRDDPIPPPWSVEGQSRIEQLSLVMQYPDGFSQNAEVPSPLCDSKTRSGGVKRRNGECLNKENVDPSNEKNELKVVIGRRGRKKRQDQIEKTVENEENEMDGCGDDHDPDKDDEAPKKKFVPFVKPRFKLPPLVQNVINKDVLNVKLWQESMANLEDGIQAFLDKVSENFLCTCCRELVYNPITTTCNHNFCKVCLQRSFKAEHYSCPTCRVALNKECLNENFNGSLDQALSLLFPGYHKGR